MLFPGSLVVSELLVQPLGDLSCNQKLIAASLCSPNAALASLGVPSVVQSLYDRFWFPPILRTWRTIDRAASHRCGVCLWLRAWSCGPSARGRPGHPRPTLSRLSVAPMVEECLSKTRSSCSSWRKSTWLSSLGLTDSTGRPEYKSPIHRDSMNSLGFTGIPEIQYHEPGKALCKDCW